MTKTVPYFDLSRQSAALEEQVLASIRQVIRDSAFASGPYVKRFEEAFADYLGCKHVIGVNSGTSALHLGLQAMDLPTASEVITTPMSFIATCWGITYAGLKPVFVDIDPVTALIDLNAVEDRVTQSTKAIVPVHLYGNAVDQGHLSKISEKHGVQIFEDAAQAHGTCFESSHIGTRFRGSAFSFYPGKSLGAFGEGGAIATNDGVYAERIRHLREHGSRVRYYHDEIGYNYRMDGFQGAVLSCKLPFLPKWIEVRRSIAKAYTIGLQGLPITLPQETLGSLHSFHLFVIRSTERAELEKFLTNRGIGCAKHYPLPLHLQPAYAFLGYKIGDFPHAERHANECLSLPMFPEMTQSEIDAVIEGIRSFYNE